MPLDSPALGASAAERKTRLRACRDVTCHEESNMTTDADVSGHNGARRDRQNRSMSANLETGRCCPTHPWIWSTTSMNISLHPGAAHLNLLDSSSRWRGVWVSGNLAQRPSASPRLASPRSGRTGPRNGTAHSMPPRLLPVRRLRSAGEPKTASHSRDST